MPTLAERVRMEQGFLDRLLAFFAWFKETAWTRRTILVADAGGIAYGFWYYLPQFEATPVHLWLFVPDSPFAVLWAFAALLLYEYGRRVDALDALAFVGNVQVGLWTAFVLLYYGRVAWPRLDFVLFWLHLAMVLHALIFLADLRREPRRSVVAAAGIAAAWYAVNDWLDYWLTSYRYEGCAGLHPITIHPARNPCAGLETVAWVTVGLTVVSVASLVALTLAGRRSPRPRIAEDAE